MDRVRDRQISGICDRFFLSSWDFASESSRRLISFSICIRGEDEMEKEGQRFLVGLCPPFRRVVWGKRRWSNSWMDSVSETGFVSIPTHEESLPTEITRALRADNRIIAADIFYFAIESFFCSSIHRIFRRALFAKTEYREKMRVEITVPINLPSRPLISASKLELFFCNSELTGCKSCLGWFLETEIGWGGFPLAGQIKWQVTFKI